MSNGRWLLLGFLAFADCIGVHSLGFENGDPDMAHPTIVDSGVPSSDSSTPNGVDAAASGDAGGGGPRGLRPACPSSTVVALAAGRTRPTALAVDGTSLYWIETGSPGQLQSMPTIGGAPPMALAQIAGDMQIPVDLALDDTTIYYSAPGTGPENAGTNGSIWSIPKVGGPTSKLADSGQTNAGNGNYDYVGHPLAVAVDGASVYWSDTAAVGYKGEMFTLGQLLSVPKGGGAIHRILGTVGANSPSGLAVDGTYLYHAADNEASLGRIPLAGGADQRFVNSIQQFRWVAVDADTLYLATGIPLGGEKLFALPKITSVDQPNPIYDGAAIGDDRASDLAVDAHQRIFFGSLAGDGSQGHVVAVDKDGSNVTVLAPLPATSLAVDDRWVYFTTADSIDVVCKQ